MNDTVAIPVDAEENTMPSWTDAWLVENPEILYGAMRPTTPSRNFTNYWQNQYNNVWDNYQRELGQMALRGQEPIYPFQSYLSNYQWLQNYLGMSPSTRGESPSTYAPRTRWLV